MASFIAVSAAVCLTFSARKIYEVDINPSVMMTININNRVINTKPLNDDADIVKTDVSGGDIVGEHGRTYKKSEEIGHFRSDTIKMLSLAMTV